MTVVEAPNPVFAPGFAPAKSRREVLLDAAALIEEHGWTRGGQGMPNHEEHSGSLCILGAVACALGYGKDTGDDLMYLYAGDLVGCPDGDAWEWNDDRDHGDGKDVVRALRRLADGATWEEAIA